MHFREFQVTDSHFKLDDFNERHLSDEEDEALKDQLYNEEVEQLKEWHLKLNAQGEQGILVVLQALDAAGKDEIIQYIFSNLLPQGIKVTSYKKPSDEEANHDYLWRMHEGLPKRGELAILNRSYYEDIISPQVHNSLKEDPIPEEIKDGPIIDQRYTQIKQFENYLVDNGFPVVKLFFHMSEEKQRHRFLERLKDPKKNHEFSFSDMDDRSDWDQYQTVFETMIQNTASEKAPWYILPADNPWLTRYVATKAIIDVLETINPEYPTFTDEEKEKAEKLIEELENKKA